MTSQLRHLHQYGRRCYSGQFSHDGKFYFSSCQDFNVRLYDTTDPLEWKQIKTLQYPYGQWTITDTSLSPDDQLIAYSSIRGIVCLGHTDPAIAVTPLDLQLGTPQRQFAVWAVKFTSDGRELVMGTSDNSVLAYDIESQRTTAQFIAHADDVNAICVDPLAPNMVYTGSDDTYIKVWDRRTMANGTPVGGFFGHLEGLTHLESQGDGLHLLSNGKDQCSKLWDIRAMLQPDQFDQLDKQDSTGFDYRFQQYRPQSARQYPDDNPVAVFKGHSILKTLIRCHFSPLGRAGKRLVYSGSEDGAVYIWTLDGDLLGKVDVNSDTEANWQSDQRDAAAVDHKRWRSCVRDASWHPQTDIIAGEFYRLLSPCHSTNHHGSFVLDGTRDDWWSMLSAYYLF
ncbi:hypothetical protein FH972_025801 [Carpinus fangiana]|uniref:Uncharacterized protein n=1 Tax=Carpinus fangiana TaxID=176857 RepID=A0A5N6L2N0_9ROSI|nr:hypothetical protein FH972_025801 [Carpinus fangiana]